MIFPNYMPLYWILICGIEGKGRRHAARLASEEGAAETMMRRPLDAGFDSFDVLLQLGRAELAALELVDSSPQLFPVGLARGFHRLTENHHVPHR